MAARESRRSALGLLDALCGEDLPHERLDFSERELRLLLTALNKQINAPLTPSMERLFDVVAALIGLRQRCRFEEQAAMALEFAQIEVTTDECYPFEITSVTSGIGGCERMIEWKPMIAALAAIIVAVAKQVGEPVVALSGGCFQNRALLERAIERLRFAGFQPYWQQRIPPNDGGSAAGL